MGQRRHPASYVSVACSGATTQDVLNNQISALNSGTTLVSITIGGNDVGFSSVMQTCVLDSDSACLSAINTATTQAKTILPGRLANTFAAIRQAAPSAHVVVLGYPELYDLGHSWYCPGLSGTDRSALNNAADLLDTQISTAAKNAGDTFADVRGQLPRPRTVRLLQRVAALGGRQRRRRLLPPDCLRAERRLLPGLQRRRAVRRIADVRTAADGSHIELF